MDTTFIYGLNDPETGECRYVGKADNPHDRLFGSTGHLKSCHKKNHHCANWIKSLVARGLRPLLEILQEVPKTEWELWERVWIKASREIGMDLTNITAGGEGGSQPGEENPMYGRKHSPETLEKMRAIKLGKKHSPKTINKMCESRAGEKNWAFGKKFSPEHRAALRAAHIGLNVGEKNPWFGKKRLGASSNFHGVTFSRPGKWRVRVRTFSNVIHIGYFSNETEAAKAYDIAAKIHHGAYAVLNFPD